eukprot:scaffold667_cov103-Skeletonema_dohrnii-CCMP3373.AAC.4
MEDIYNAIVDSDSDSDEDDDDDEISCGSEMVVDAKSDEKQLSKLLPPPLQQQQQQPTAAESITTAISLKVASLVQRMLGLSQEYQELHEELMNKLAKNATFQKNCSSTEVAMANEQMNY